MTAKKFIFEHAFLRLEEIAEMLESGTATIEETISLFEEANELNKKCSEFLDKAESKLKIMLKENDELKLEFE